jgi:hypothetical protein
MGKDKYIFDHFKRQKVSRLPRKVTLILCEGSKTEPNYLRHFPYNSMTHYVDIRPSCCRHALGIVEEAVKYREGYESVWCVFDKDRNPDKDFNQAIVTAKNENILCAYSNECFELWFLLHFQYNESQLSRSGIANFTDRLNAELHKIKKGKYDKARIDLYEILQSRQACAIRNAKKLLQKYSASTTPSEQNPSTTVHKLVAYLNALRR